MNHSELSQYYLDQGLRKEEFWIGPEHPALEEFAIKYLKQSSSKVVLEIGYQAGGFAAPIIYNFKDYESFIYLGIDNLSYVNSVNGDMIATFLSSKGVKPEKFKFMAGDAKVLVSKLNQKYDLILLDHLKQLYPRELKLIFSNNMLASNGIIMAHDILDKASEPWKKCVRLCARHGYTWEIYEEIPAGLAVIKKDPDFNVIRKLVKYFS